MLNSDPFHEKIHQEILQIQQMRRRIDARKVAFVIALLGFGSIKLSDSATFYYSLYLAPLVALLFDFMSMGHTFAIRRNGKFLRNFSPSQLEQKYENFVSKNRDNFFRFGSFCFSVLAYVASFLLLKVAEPKSLLNFGGLILISMFLIHIILFYYAQKKIKFFDSISNKIIWICPGNVSLNCKGQIGDVILSSAVAKYLSDTGSRIHFITNKIMEKWIKNSYKDFTVSRLLEKNDVSLYLRKRDLAKCTIADKIVILRPEGDSDSILWRQQLKNKKVDNEIIFQTGSLDAYNPTGPHMINQILRGINEPLISDEKYYPFPLLKVNRNSKKYKKYFKDRKKSNILILPFAGGKNKCLTINILCKLVDKLKKDNNILVTGTEYDCENNLDKWNEYKKKLRSKDVDLITVKMEDIPLLAINCEKIYCVDGGMCWITVAGLNFSAELRKWNEDEYPQIIVIVGKDSSGKNAPSVRVWKPLAKFSGRIKHVNADQKKQMDEITVDDILTAEVITLNTLKDK